jgi:hypothetical protein
MNSFQVSVLLEPGVPMHEANRVNIAREKGVDGNVTREFEISFRTGNRQNSTVACCNGSQLPEYCRENGLREKHHYRDQSKI